MRDGFKFWKMTAGLCPREIRAAKEFLQRIHLHTVFPDELLGLLDRDEFGLKSFPSLCWDKSQLLRFRGQAAICIVLSQLQSILRSTGKHAIRFVHTVGDKVVNQDSDIGFISPQNHGRSVLQRERSVDAGDQALRTRLLVAGRTIDLTGEKEALNGLGFQ